MCLFFDKLLMIERLAGRSEISSMFKNIILYAYQSHLLLCWLILEKVPPQNHDNKWCVFLKEVTKNKLQVTSQLEAIRLIQSNNDNAVIVIRSLIKQVAIKQAFFETVTLSLQNLAKISPRVLMEAL